MSKMRYDEGKDVWVTESESEAAALRTKYFCFNQLTEVLKDYVNNEQASEIIQKLKAAIDQTGQDEDRIQDTLDPQRKEIVFKRTAAVDLARQTYNNYEMFCGPHELSNNKARIRDKVHERVIATSSQHTHIKQIREEEHDE